MDAKANAILAVLLTSTTNAKHTSNTRFKTEKLWTPVHKEDEEQVRVALVDAGRDDWMRFKRECVLLKRKG